MTSQYDTTHHKSRKFSSGPVNQQSITGVRPSGGSWSYSGGVSTLTNTGVQDTWTEGHPFKGYFEGGDVGGPFKTVKRYITTSKDGDPISDFEPWRVNLREAFIPPTGTARSWDVDYIFPHSFINPVDGVFTYAGGTVPVVSNESQLLALGTTAIARCKPTNAVADLAVGLAELAREGFPHMVGLANAHQAGFAGKVGSEFLNYQFGIKPLLNDLKKFVFAYENRKKLYSHYKRDSGRLVRRRYSFPLETSTNKLSEETSYGNPATVTNFYSQKPDVRYYKMNWKKTWFSGAFRYYVPDDTGNEEMDSFVRKYNELQSLYGAHLTLEVVWNLIPWSWLSDWFLNTGDLISNISDTMEDGLVLEYGYVMQTVKEIVEVSPIRDGRFINGHTFSIQPQVFVRETKQRLEATPYGFGLTWDSFSPRQLAILAALGVTRR